MAWPCLSDVHWLRLLLTTLVLPLLFTRAQPISTTAPVPPLQWINLSGLLNGPGPPPLKDAAIGYDPDSNTLLIFGGESSQQFPQANTYLLDLDSLTWIKPAAPYGLEDIAPSARSAAVGGSDFAANSRHGHVLIGGLGANGVALSDVWEFDYLNHFWSQVNVASAGPARWGATGGIDTRVNDGQVVLNTTFYLAGGSDGTNVHPLSELWSLQLSGTLSSNIPTGVYGSWEKISIGTTLPSKVNLAGTIVYDRIMAFGGCNATSTSDNCAQADSYILDTSNDQTISPPACPAARFGASAIPNMNTQSASFQTQAFVLLGTFESSMWIDPDNGLQHGEVDVLDVSGGSWARVLPSGDPGTSGTQTFPSPRQGAAVLSYPSAIVGSSSSVSDTIVFGGRDASGNYFSDVWLLRSYNGVLTASGDKWSGYGDGTLQTGVNASGEGVEVKYLTKCVAAANTTSNSTTSSSTTASAGRTTTTVTGAPINTQSGTPQNAITYPYDASVSHKLLAPVSIALLTLAVLSYRFSSTSAPLVAHNPEPRAALVFLSAAAAIAAYGTGLAGLAFSFTSIWETSMQLSKRSSSAGPHLKTTHGKAGLALFVVLYGVLPLCFLGHAWYGRRRRMPTSPRVEAVPVTLPTPPARARVDSDHSTTDHAAAEKADYEPTFNSSQGTVAYLNSELSSPKPQTRSSGQSLPHTSYPPARSQSQSPTGEPQSAHKDSPSEGSTLQPGSPPRTFEVVNRPTRTSRQGSSGLAAFAEQMHLRQQPIPVPRTLGEVSWLERRRSLNAVGELDYVISQLHKPHKLHKPEPADAADALGADALGAGAVPGSLAPEMPGPGLAVLHVALHALILAVCILTLVALWLRAPRAGFAVFLTWTVCFYAALLVLAWHGRPRVSITAALMNHFRPRHEYIAASTTPPTPRPASIAATDHLAGPSETRHPYLHQPPVRATFPRAPPEDDFTQGASHVGHRSVEDSSGDEEDDDTRQQRMEDEMNRREVSIVTVPKKKLWVTNL